MIRISRGGLAPVLRMFLAVFALAVIPAPSHAGSSPSVERFTPEGYVAKVRQATVRFSEPMVPFGDLRLPDPFTVSCTAKGKGRWADERNWVYDFEEDLPAGVVATFRLLPSLKSLAGAPVTGRGSFSFTTGGPSIVQSIPYEGTQYVDEEQAFLLVLSGEAEPESILAHASFSVEGIGDAVGVRLIAGEERTRLINSGPSRALVAIFRTIGGRADLLEFRKKKEFDDPRIVVLQARQRFPAESRVRLNWGAGVRTKSGVGTVEPQILEFKTRPPFQVKFTCDREQRKGGCLPMLPMTLNFTAPVSRKMAGRIVLESASGKTYKPGIETDSPETDEEGKVEFANAALFPGPFPPNTRFTIRLPKDMTDDAGRRPANADSYPLPVSTTGYPPLAKFAAPFGIVEWADGEALLPVTIRNLEREAKHRVLDVERSPSPPVPETGPEASPRKVPKGSQGDWMASRRAEAIADLKGRIRPVGPGKEGEILGWLRKVERAYQYHEPDLLVSESILPPDNTVAEFALPRPGGDNAFEVVGIPLPKPGLYIVELESRRLGASLLDHEPMYVPTAALVTDLSAHFKKGRESSIVWVTSLGRGEPVDGARVVVHDASGRPLWTGTTGSDGIARIAGELSPARSPARCGEFCGYFVTARKGEDLTFVLSSWQNGIESWRYNMDGVGEADPSIAHTVFDRTLFRAGETVSMKHFLRRHVSDGLAGPDAKRLPKGVAIVHQGSEQRYAFPLSWDASGGIAETTFAIPREAKLGVYDVYLLDEDLSREEARTDGKKMGGGDVRFWRLKRRMSGSFRVEEFRVPLMKAGIRPVGGPLVRPKAATLDLSVAYLSGGGAGNASVKLRTAVVPGSVSFPEFEGFLFANGPIREGVIRGGETFQDDGEGEDSGDAEALSREGGSRKSPVRTRDLILDPAGSLRATVDALPVVSVPSDLQAELEFADPNGEVQTVSARVPLYPARRLPGILPDGWAASKEDFRFKVAVADLSGNAVKNAEVAVDLFRRSSFTHRKRLTGGFYAYEYVTETKKLVDRFCAGTTDDKGLLFCSGKSPVSGNILLQARVVDDDGAVASANRDVWIAGKDDWWFDQQDGDRIDLVPERKRYEPGDTARFQVRMPFREATALITVEREGVLETFVRTLSGKKPVLEIPVLSSYAPNVYVSALVVRGRVPGAAPTAMVDLGKPAYRLGNAEISVGWKAHELRVGVGTDREVYAVRDKVKARFQVRRADGGTLPPGSEVAIAAVDAGLLELSPNGSWDLLRAMMGRRPHEVATSTAQSRVVGKRHFGLKALPAGGSGGRQSSRKLFDTLLFWKGRVPLDANGEAQVEIPLNDSLTAFRLVAVASGGDSLFGTGEKTIRTTQPIMVLPGLPPLVREGDRFRAGVTVRNGGERPLRATVTARVGPPDARSALTALPPPRQESLAPGESREMSWDYTVQAGIEALAWRFEVVSDDNSASDKVEVRQKVMAAVPVRTVQATIAQVEKPLSLPVAKPADALPRRGGVSVDLAASLSDGMEAVRYFMARYPYECLEQKVSVAVALRDPSRWEQIASILPSYVDGDGLLKYFPQCIVGDDALTAYFVSIADESGWKIPANLENRILDGLDGFVSGRVVRYGALKTADLSIRKMAAVEALSRRGRWRAGLLDSVTVSPNLWPTSGVLDWTNVLLRVNGIPDRERRLAEAETVLRARLNFQGTTMGFSTERTDFLWWLMVSGDVNAVKGLLTFLKLPSWKADIPRVVNGALGRQKRGAWNTTVANAWGVLAVERFAKLYEGVPVSGKTRASIGEAVRVADWGAAPRGSTLSFPWPAGKGGTLSVAHEGTGKPWVTFRSLAAIPLKEAISTGYRIRKTVAPVSRRAKGTWSRGDVFRVTLEIEAQSDMTWVVVDDPVPSGAAILGGGLGRDSSLSTRGEKREGLAWPAFEERAFDGFRAFYEFVPKGKWTVAYTVRLNNPGKFLLPPTRVEAMYAPEMFGESPNGAMTVSP
jgi:uncharacterized protein YfaS (alpha-2-macroglobulin family)